MSESLSRLGARVTGIDFVANNINIAAKLQKKNKNMKILQWRYRKFINE